MAITKLAAPLAGLRGTIGGITYSENKSATYAKLWNPPSNPRTVLQSQQRAFLNEIAQDWGSITASDRAGWDTFAALPAQALTNSLGDTYYISGFLWFVKCNTRLLQAGLATSDTAPVSARPGIPTITGIVYKTVTSVLYAGITFGAGEFGSHSGVIFYAVSVGGAPAVKYSGFYLATVANAIGGGATSLDFATQHEDRWGSPDNGWRMHLQVFAQSTEGLRSAPWGDFAQYPTP